MRSRPAAHNRKKKEKSEEKNQTRYAGGTGNRKRETSAGSDVIGPAKHEAGDCAGAADRARGVVEAHPEALGAFFCLACCEALAGRPDDAARHLRHALERSDRLRGLARRNSDLDSIRDRPEIAELLAG